MYISFLDFNFLIYNSQNCWLESRHFYAVWFKANFKSQISGMMKSPSICAMLFKPSSTFYFICFKPTVQQFCEGVDRGIGDNRSSGASNLWWLGKLSRGTSASLVTEREHGLSVNRPVSIEGQLSV